MNLENDKLNIHSDYLVVLLATYNRLESLKRAIDSISTGTHCSHEIIVIDGGSTDGTIEFLRSETRATPVFQGKLIGQARACNQVWRQVNARYTCWLNDDTELITGSLDLAVDILEKHSEIGMVGLKMKDTLGLGASKPYVGARSKKYGILNCNHGVLPMSLLRSVGYFNEEYNSYQVDPDLTASVLCTGKSVVLTKQVCVLHHRAGVNTAGEKRSNELEHAIKVYNEKFSFLESSSCQNVEWRQTVRKKLVNLLIPKGVPDSRLLGLNQRDRANLLKGRFISPVDPIKNIFNPYYLVQRIPQKLLLSTSNPYRNLING